MKLLPALFVRMPIIAVLAAWSTAAMLVGDPPCPPSCATECPLTPVDPSVIGTGCETLELTWTRKQDGCCTEGSTCRVCKGRLRVEVTMTEACFQAGGGSVAWSTYQQLGAGTPWIATGGGKGGATLDPLTGLYTYVDLRDLDASCGQAARMTVSVGGTGSVAGSAEFACDACGG